MPFVMVDDTLAGWMSVCLRAGAQVLSSRGAQVPRDVLELAHEIHLEVTAGQGVSIAEVLDEMVDAASMDNLLLTYDEAARRLSVSVSTLKRRIADGSIATVTVGSKPLIHRDDLEAYAASLRGTGDKPDRWGAQNKTA